MARDKAMSVAERARRGASPPPASKPANSRILRGDAFDVLAGLPDGLAQTCITSPPYWGLRDYGVAPRVWGGDPGCRHRWGAGERGRRSDLLPAERSGSKGRLDPFAGAATAGVVAARHGRDFLGIELSGEYARMARRRLREAASVEEVGA